MPPDTLAAQPGSKTLLFRHRPFVFFTLGRGFSAIAYQMSAVAVGWQVYAMTGSAYDLGLVGLAQFVPMAALTFAAGHAADRYARKRVLQACQVVEAIVALFLAVWTFAGWLTVPEIFAAVAVFGAARAFGTPASGALLPGVVPEGDLQRGTAVASGAFQAATIVGPAIGGFAYAVAPALPYGLMAALWLLATAMNGAIKLDRPVVPREPPTLKTLFAGVGFIRRNPAMLGAISLDLFAVLLGGAAGLFPIYARDILHTGPWGLGFMRGALAVGGLAMTGWLGTHKLERKTGLRMFQGVILFGIATLVFGLSRNFILTLAALCVMGAADTVSVVIRVSLVQLRTPDDMRGRVSAVNYLFINASNNLGDFESGVTAGLLGAVPAVLLGGAGCILVALAWMRLFPSLRQIDRLE
jgi:MFS family permease